MNLLVTKVVTICVTGISNQILLTLCGFRLQFKDSVSNLRIPRQRNFTMHIYRYLFVGSKNCSGFRLFLSEYSYILSDISIHR